MAKKGSSRGAQNSAPTTPTPSNRRTSMTSTKSQMVLRVKESRQKLKATEEEPTVSKKLKATSKKKIAKIDTKKPKKPPTAFFYFLEDFRKEFQEQNPEIKSMRDIGKACGEKWKKMTFEEKVYYYDVATEKRRGFDRAMVDFNKRKENGEFQEYEEDSDFDE